MAAFHREAELGMVMSRKFRTGIVAQCLMAKREAGDMKLLDNSSAAMVDKSRVVIADDPYPVEPGGELLQQGSRVGRQAVAAEPVVKTVAQAE